MKKPSKKFLLAATALVVVCSSAVFLFIGSGDDSLFDVSLIHNTGDTNYDYRQGVSVVPGEYRNSSYNDITGDYRPMYSELSEEQYIYFFGNLPSFPADFFDVTKLVYEGKITDYSRLGEEYWMQPEFYPAWFGVFKNSSYVDYNPLRWTPEGYGCYPAIKEVTVSHDAGSFIVDTYFKTGYATESYQGLIVRPMVPSSARALDGSTLFDNPSDAESLLSLRILNPDDPLYMSFKDSLIYDNVGPEDWFVVLKPTFGTVKDKYGSILHETGFPSDWVRLLQLEVTMADNIPLGDYVVSIDVDTPCFEINQEYYYSTTHEYYGALYYPAGWFHRSNTPHFQVVIHVI